MEKSETLVVECKVSRSAKFCVKYCRRELSVVASTELLTPVKEERLFTVVVETKVISFWFQGKLLAPV